MKQKSSQVFLSRALRYTSQALAAAWTQKPAMGGRSWNAIQGVPQETEKSYVLWINSTFGILSYFNEGQRQDQGRGQMQVRQIGNFLLPDLRNLPHTRLSQADKDFDSIARQNLLPVAKMDQDPVRELIDQAVICLLDLPSGTEDILKDIRSRLAREPAINGKAL